MNDSLFRPEAVERSKSKPLSGILLIQPLAVNVLTVVSLLIGLALLAFLIFGTYTKKERVTGVLLPNLGLVRVAAPQMGTVVKREVTEGQVVKRGHVLYRISSDRAVGSEVVGQLASNQSELKRQSLEEQLNRQNSMNEISSLQSAQKISALQQQLAQINSELSIYKEQLRIANDVYKRNQALVDEGFISSAVLEDKRNNYLNQLNNQKRLMREKTSIQQQLSSAKTELEDAKLKGDNQNASITQSITDNETQRELLVLAPIDGVASAIQADVGQVVNANTVLLSIVPTDALLEANVYLSSRAIGFIKEGNSVLLRYQAFPYQKFGQHEGEVVSISKVALTNNELIEAGILKATEPMYRVKIKPASQTIMAYGKQEALQPSMQLEADVLMDTRRLYEWLFEPLFSITGRLMGSKV
ncbi:Colicin V secretion protein CvaA [Ephemeroptericola cinctiostellae]|uniref:Colicin V secretion protein CvaA n=1 Tax=Ephemeroptericola cinctiostellae TaxID=2268024 RepID=A0A345DBL2_9BURK|nr:HlyD family efflux transporter periplasmic adaptor subunit [Ephemeroptericola cinctiostellae]AXF85750.1 Colicin V secretion protein CvaA [Ephemeroptericola cinctiostellae]